MADDVGGDQDTQQVNDTDDGADLDTDIQVGDPSTGVDYIKFSEAEKQANESHKNSKKKSKGKGDDEHTTLDDSKRAKSTKPAAVEEYEPFDKWSKNPVNGINLASTYMSAILTPLSANTSDYTQESKSASTMFVVVVGWSYIIHFLNLFIQTTILYYFYRQVYEDTNRACTVDALITAVVLIVFTSLCWKEILDNLATLEWLYNFPRADRWEALKVCSVKGGSEAISSGMTLWYKILSLFIVVLPKIGFSFAITFLGSLYILRAATPVSAIFASLSLFFVVGIDENLYRVLYPVTLQSILAGLPKKFAYKQDDTLNYKLGLAKTILSPLASIIFMGVTSGLLYHYGCTIRAIAPNSGIPAPGAFSGNSTGNFTGNSTI